MSSAFAAVLGPLVACMPWPCARTAAACLTRARLPAIHRVPLHARSALHSSASFADGIEKSWASALEDELADAHYASLEKAVRDKRAEGAVFPPGELVFSAFAHTPFDSVKVVILGQDPYHSRGQAHGLSFSVRAGTSPPPSLRNILAELRAELGVTPQAAPDVGDLSPWCAQGVLLLNTVLTVSEGRPLSHANLGWERLTDCVVRRLSERRRGLVFILWGAPARKKAALIDRTAHLVLEAAHPSPLSCRRGFFGCGHFVDANRYLEAAGATPVDWASIWQPVAAARVGRTSPMPSVDPSPESSLDAAGRSLRLEAAPAEAAPAPTPATPGSAPRKRKSTPPTPFVAPERWQDQLALIQSCTAPAALSALSLAAPGAPAEEYRFQLLVGLLLSSRAQSESAAEGFARITRLCAGSISAQRLCARELPELEAELGAAGVQFPRVKAQYVHESAHVIVGQYGGKTPRALAEVMALPGVGPKAAHLFTQAAWGDVHGIAVDSHVHRIAARIGWCLPQATVERARTQLESWLPKELWQPLNPLLAGFGQAICAETPRCGSCPLAENRLCKSAIRTPAVADLPTDAQVLRAATLAVLSEAKLGLEARVLVDRGACEQFIESATQSQR